MNYGDNKNEENLLLVGWGNIDFNINYFNKSPNTYIWYGGSDNVGLMVLDDKADRAWSGCTSHGFLSSTLGFI